MQSISNQKGAYQRFIRCHLAETSTQKVTLKDVFIKKSENYIVNLGNFHMNANIPLFMEDEQKEPSVEFLYKDDQLNNYPNAYGVNDRLQLYSKFNSGVTERDASVSGFVDRLRDFVDRFNYKLNIYGGPPLGNGQDIDPIPPLLGQPAFANSQHDLHTYVDENDVARHVDIGITEDGRLVFRCSRYFLSGFYIKFGPKFQKLCGFDQFIWATTLAGALVTSQTDNYESTDLFINALGVDVFQFQANAFAGNLEPLFFPATKSTFSADTRLSLDIEATLPLFNSVTSEFSIEKQEFLLERFSIPDYLDVETSNTSTNDLIITGVDFHDGLMSGVKDLVRDPHTHVIGMRSGFIQALNVTLWVRYMMNNEIKKTRLVLQEGEWVDFTLVFTKKV